MEVILEDSLDTAPAGFLVFAEDSSIITVNTTLVNMLNYAGKEELTGKKVEILFTIAGKIFYQTHFFPLLVLHGKANEIYFHLKPKTGENIPVFVNAVRKVKERNTTYHCLFFLVQERSRFESALVHARNEAERILKDDIALNDLREQLAEQSIKLDREIMLTRRNNDDIMQFSKILSHDLLEPIRKIAVQADRIAEQARNVLTKQQVQELLKINAESRRLRQLVLNLEKFISLNTNDADRSTVDLAIAVKDGVEVLGESKSNLQIHFYGTPLPSIVANRSQLAALFENLFSYLMTGHPDSLPLTIAITCAIVQLQSLVAVKESRNVIDFVSLHLFAERSNEDLTQPGNPLDLTSLDSNRDISRNFGLSLSNKIVDNHFGSLVIDQEGIRVTLPVDQQ